MCEFFCARVLLRHHFVHGGDQGTKGKQGPQGPQGKKGDQGEPGDDGKTINLSSHYESCSGWRELVRGASAVFGCMCDYGDILMSTRLRRKNDDGSINMITIVGEQMQASEIIGPYGAEGRLTTVLNYYLDSLGGASDSVDVMTCCQCLDVFP